MGSLSAKNAIEKFSCLGTFNSDASNSMNESNSRTANTVGTPTTEGTIAKVMKPLPAYREDKHNMDTINMR